MTTDRSDGSEPAIVARGLCKEYRLGHERSNLRQLLPGRLGDRLTGETFLAVNDVSFEVARGEALGIVGVNGAGKSTILKMLAGIVRPSSGVLGINGTVAALIELGAGFEEHLSGEENVYFLGALAGRPRSYMRRSLDEIVEFSGLDGFMDMPVKRYSTGMRARLAFSVATAVRPDILIVDEVLSVGDVGFQRRSLERIREMHQDGATLVLVSHNMWMAEQLCDRLLLIEHGVLQLEGPPSLVISTYLGPHFRAESDPSIDAPTYEHMQVADDASLDVTISSFGCEPSEIDPGGGVQLHAVIEVHRPVDALMVMSLYTSGRAVFAEREVGPSEFLSTAGRWSVTISIEKVPIATGVYQFRLGVLPASSPDPEQAFTGALAVAEAPVTIRGLPSARPGIYLEADWSVEPVAEG